MHKRASNGTERISQPLTIALGLPYGVTDSPQSGYDEKHRKEVHIRHRNEQIDHDPDMEYATDPYYGLSGQMSGNDPDQD